MSSAAAPTEGVLLLIRSLNCGGAERQLVQFAIALQRCGIAVEVVTFYDGGIFRNELDLAGVANCSLGKQGRWDLFGFISRLLRLVRARNPAVLYGYLSTANLLLAVFKPCWRGARVVWGVRASNVTTTRYDRLTLWVDRFERVLSHMADLIIANSEAGRRHAIVQGFPANKLITIANGIDMARFRFNAVGRDDMRSGWGVRDDELLVGLVARIDPMKDHPTFLAAASRLARNCPQVRFVCVGEGSAVSIDQLKSQAQALGLAGRIIWAGSCDDMAAVQSALDIAISASAFGEGFSNAIAEAMACERPCVVTDVGDSALIVGETGRVVPPSDPQALAEGIMLLINLTADQRARLGSAARTRIESEFSLETMAMRSIQALGLDRCA
jgi:glycosyltransferase involved in cell wall biosynthesis